MLTEVDKVRLPEFWPSSPDMVSYSSMALIESCPRQWALANAEYCGIWDLSGYPRRVGYAAARGQIIHACLELLVGALRSHGCENLRSKEAVAVLKELGGFSNIIEQVRRNFVQVLESNPRMDKILRNLERRLVKDTPNQISIVQEMLLRSDTAFAFSNEDMAGDKSDDAKFANFSLGMGSHTEVFLKSEEIGWFGIADLISITADKCEIRDFKTGGEEAHHADQLKTYAALWYKDKRLNPESLLANRLVLSYPGHDSEVSPPNTDE